MNISSVSFLFADDERFLGLWISGIAILIVRCRLWSVKIEFFHVNWVLEDEAYREAMRKGLSYFDESGLYIDTEDRERVCLYFQQMMDVVGMESSGGILNTWLYGFDVG